jgi:hypothetical protein
MHDSTYLELFFFTCPESYYLPSSISHEVSPRHLLANKDWLGRLLLSQLFVFDFGLTLAITSSTPPPLSELLDERLLGAEVVHRTTPNSRLAANNIKHLRIEVESISG